jgi:hypothetical protein
MFEEQEGLFEQGNDVNVGEVIGLDARIIQEVGDDLVEALGFAADDVHQFFVVFIERGEAGEFLERSGHGR